jgi:cysteine synthase A
MLLNWERNRRVAADLSATTGYTPMVRLNRVTREVAVPVFAKLEYFGPSGSVKDRILFAMVAAAEARGELRPGMTLIEGTTGNTGIATAMVGAVKGYPVVIVMPEGMSDERKQTICAYGAQLLLTPGGESDVDLVLERVQELKAQHPGRYWEVGQFRNADNVAAHYATTGPEIWEQSQGQVDCFVAAQGTGGTLTGAVRFLKEQKPKLRAYAAEPAECPILSAGDWGTHRIEGIGDGFIPEVLDLDLVDGVVQVSSEEAIAMARRLAREEGIFAGISSGCNVVACLKVAKAHPEFNFMVTTINDNGQRYLSTELCGAPRPQHPGAGRQVELSAGDRARLAARTFEIIR